DFVLGVSVAVWIHPHPVLREVPDVAPACRHRVVGPEISLQCLRLRGRLHDHQLLCHLFVRLTLWSGPLGFSIRGVSRAFPGQRPPIPGTGGGCYGASLYGMETTRLECRLPIPPVCSRTAQAFDPGPWLQHATKSKCSRSSPSAHPL